MESKRGWHRLPRCWNPASALRRKRCGQASILAKSLPGSIATATGCRRVCAWLLLSNGLYRQGPIIHPITAIGPMVIFSQIHDLLVQPESWFELGNPNIETICIDLAYRWPGGSFPVFTSGDSASGSVPRIIARSFEEWLLELLRYGGREYWFDADFVGFGDPWQAHRRYTPQPDLPDRLRPFAGQILPLMQARVEEREIAHALGLSHGDVELLFRHLQHVAPDMIRS